MWRQRSCIFFTVGICCSVVLVLVSVVFAPWPFRLKGYCRCLHLAICLSACLSVFTLYLARTLLFKSNGIFCLRWQNMVFIFKVQTWNFVCGIRKSFAFTMENILIVWYTATPGWTSKFGKVWKMRCQNAAIRANIWRCFLVSWDDKYLWVMVSKNRHEL